MSYTKEMCLYLLDHPDNIEAESLTESVERQVFQAMNKAISMRVGDRTPWRGQYALVTGDDEEAVGERRRQRLLAVPGAWCERRFHVLRVQDGRQDRRAFLI